MSKRFEGKVAVITGAAQGLGREVALLLAEGGARVVVADLKQEMVDCVVQDIASRGGEARGFVGDLTSEQTMTDLIGSAEQAWGHLDVMVNNAGTTQYHRITETSEDEWQRTIDANLKSQFLGCKHAVEAMRRNGGGAIVNIGSISSLVALPDQGAYGPAKGGTLMLTRQAALDFAADGIRVNCVCPGPMDTPMLRKNAEAYPDPQAWKDDLAAKVPLHRISHPREVAQVVVFLASDEASYVTGAIVSADGGWTIH